MAKFIKLLKHVKWLKRSTGRSTGSSLLLVTILILQLQIQLSSGQTEPTSTTPPAPVSSSASPESSSTVLSSASTEEAATPTKESAATQAHGQSEPTTRTDLELDSGAAVLDEKLPDGSDRDDGNVGAALALAEAKRTTVKKELAPTTEPTPVQEQATTSATSNDGRPLENLLPSMSNIQSQQQSASELGAMSPGLSGAISDLAEQVPNVYNRDQQNYSDPARVAAEEAAFQRLLPASSNFFDKEAIEATQLGEMDCHLRNLDLCLAGLLGSSTKVLPETDTELETRCDEMKVTTSCMAMYNKRCGTFKLFSMLAPFAQQSSNMLTPNSNLLTERQKELLASSAAGISERAGLMAATSDGKPQFSPSLQSLMELCEPSAKKQAENKQIRQRLFQLAKCVNARIPRLTPCLEDLKTALQLFYEPRRVLPLRPTCCALARLRVCSTDALDRVCGLSSFEQLMSQFSGQVGASNGPAGMIQAIDRVCKQATDHRSTYCREVLPPSGMKLPPRRSSKSSKLVKALDLISFSPATQDLGAF